MTMQPAYNPTHAEGIRSLAAARASQAVGMWRPQIMGPSTRKADRAVTFGCIMTDVVYAVLGGRQFGENFAAAQSILAQHGIVIDQTS